MKYLITLLAFIFLIGCDGEKSNTAPSKDSPEEAASEAPSERSPKEATTETKPPEAVSVNPNLKYEIKGDAVTVTRCDEDASGELIIPANIEGKPVTSIGGGAFSACFGLTSITIGNGVTSIGDSAFADCFGLTSITIPNSVTSIGGGSFYLCNSLRNITIPDGVTSIGSSAFYGCTSLTTVTFLGDAPKISNDAFGVFLQTIYREADAKGWGDTFAGRPVKLITEKP